MLYRFPKLTSLYLTVETYISRKRNIPPFQTSYTNQQNQQQQNSLAAPSTSGMGIPMIPQGGGPQGPAHSMYPPPPAPPSSNQLQNNHPNSNPLLTLGQLLVGMGQGIQQSAARNMLPYFGQSGPFFWSRRVRESDGNETLTSWQNETLADDEGNESAEVLQTFVEELKSIDIRNKAETQRVFQKVLDKKSKRLLKIGFNETRGGDADDQMKRVKSNSLLDDRESQTIRGYSLIDLNFVG